MCDGNQGLAVVIFISVIVGLIWIGSVASYLAAAALIIFGAYSLFELRKTLNRISDEDIVQFRNKQ